MSEIIWHIDLFGSLCVRKEGDLPVHLRTLKAGALLAYLASYPQKVHTREALVELLWPNVDREKGRGNLRVVLNSLLKMLPPVDSDTSIVTATRDTVQLNQANCTTDLAEFEFWLQKADEMEVAQEKIEALKQAVSHYHGRFLADLNDTWIDLERNRLDDRYEEALEQLMRLFYDERNYAGALNYAQQFVALDPYHEARHRALIQIYSRMGHPSDALRQYQTLKEILKRDDKALPEQKTRNLIRQVLGLPQDAPEGVLDRMTAAQSVPPPHFLPSVVCKLPVPLTPLYGRETDISRVREKLERRLVTLTGLGGGGKTRLAIAAAESYQRVASVWFVSLAALTDGSQLLETIVEALDLSPRAKRMPLKALKQTLASARPLLVLDNFEQIAETGALPLKSLLDEIPELRCLVTSRDRLNISGEYEYIVRPLATPLQEGTPERLLEFASVQLFADRARAVNPDFEVTRENAEAVATLCHQLEGLPLAIELAAAWAQSLTPAEIVELLKERFAVLVSRRQDSPARHASLRAALDWSYDLLTPELRTFFARLSVFRGTFDSAAARQVCEEPQALDYITRLRGRSLVNVETTGAKAKYVLLETVREYADECLSDTDRKRFASRHAAYYLEQAEQNEPKLRGAEVEACVNYFQSEYGNFRTALDWFLSNGEADHFLRQCVALWRFWYTRGHHKEGLGFLTTALAKVPDAPVTTRIMALAGAGNIAFELREYDRAKAFYLEALELRKGIGDKRGIAASLGGLGNIAHDLEQWEEACKLHRRSLDLFCELNEERGIALASANLGLALGAMEDFEEARRLLEDAIAVCRRLNDTQHLALNLTNLAHIFLKNGRSWEARPLLEESWHLSVRLNSPQLLAQGLALSATLALQQNEHYTAARLLGAAEAIEERTLIFTPLHAREEQQYKVNRLREALGDEAFEQARKIGRTMNLEQLTAYLGTPVNERFPID